MDRHAAQYQNALAMKIFLCFNEIPSKQVAPMPSKTKQGRPRKFALDEESTPIQVRFGNRLLARIDDAFHVRRLPSRADTIRTLVAEALGVKQ
jgi:hypothetical protein